VNIGEMQRKLSQWAERDKNHRFFDLEFNKAGQLLQITLNTAAPYVREIASALEKLLAATGVAIKVGAT
jgi:hypothetical protein